MALHGYTLLPRGLWLLATPVDAGGLGRAMQSIGRRFVRWVNDRRGEHGSIFAGRYRAAAIEPEAGSLRALAYRGNDAAASRPGRDARPVFLVKLLASIWDWRPIRSCGRCRPTGRWETPRSTARPRTGGCWTLASARMRRPALPRPFPVDGLSGHRPLSARSRHGVHGVRDPPGRGALVAVPRLRRGVEPRVPTSAALWQIGRFGSLVPYVRRKCSQTCDVGPCLSVVSLFLSQSREAY